MFKYIFSVAVVILIAGCGRASGIDDDYVVGNWQTECEGLSIAGSEVSGYYTSVMSFSDSNEFSLQIEAFTDELCEDSVSKEAPVSGSYELGRGVVTTMGFSAVEIDLNFGANITLDIVYVDQGVMVFGAAVEGEPARPSALNFDTKLNNTDI